MATSAVIKLSLSKAVLISSTDLPVCLEYISFNLFFNARTSLACISMSVAWPWNPAEGWWTIILEFGKENLLPFFPADNKKEVSKEEAEKILKQSQNQDKGTKQASKKKVETKKKEVKKTTPKTKSPAKKTKKVSKK